MIKLFKSIYSNIGIFFSFLLTFWLVSGTFGLMYCFSWLIGQASYVLNILSITVLCINFFYTRAYLVAFIISIFEFNKRYMQDDDDDDDDQNWESGDNVNF